MRGGFRMTSRKACLVVILALVNVQAKKADHYEQTVLSLALFPAVIIHNHITLTQALGTVEAYVTPHELRCEV